MIRRRRNFSSASYVIEPPSLEQVSKHWFLRGEEFQRYPILGGKAQLYLYEEDKGHAIDGKKALYFDCVHDGERFPVFFGIEYSNVGFYPKDDRYFKHGFEFGNYAKKFYNMVKDLRKEHKRFREFHTWFRDIEGGVPYIKDIVSECPLESFYDMNHFDPSDFVACTGSDNIEFFVGSYDEPFMLPDDLANHLLIDTVDEGFDSDAAALLFSVKDEQIDAFSCTVRNIEEDAPLLDSAIVTSPGGSTEVGNKEETCLQDNPLERHYDNFFTFV